MVLVVMVVEMGMEGRCIACCVGLLCGVLCVGNVAVTVYVRYKYVLRGIMHS